MPKNKPHKGLLKRVRITKSGKIKMRPAHGRHLRSHKTGDTLRSYRKAKYFADVDLRRIAPLLIGRVSMARLAKARKMKAEKAAEREAGE